MHGWTKEDCRDENHYSQVPITLQLSHLKFVNNFEGDYGDGGGRGG